jgi:uncharacterized membrane protein
VPASSASLFCSWFSAVYRLDLQGIQSFFNTSIACGCAGVFLNFLVGELDRERLIDNAKSYRTYKATFYLTFGIMIFAVILGAIMNPQTVISTLSKIPYIAAGVALLICVSYAILTYSSRRFSRDDKKEPLIV